MRARHLASSTSAIVVASVVSAVLLSGCASPIERGESLYRQGDLRGAVELWKSVPEGNRGHDDAQARLKAAEEEFERTLRRYEMRGHFYAVRGRLAEALLHYRLALKLDPSRGTSLSQIQEIVRDLDTRERSGREALSQAMSRGDLVAASQQMQALEKLDPYNPELRLQLEQARSIVGARAENHLRTGKGHYEGGDLEQAEREFQRVLELESDNESALGYLSFIRLTRQKRLPSDLSAISPSEQQVLAEGHFRRAVASEKENAPFTAIQQYTQALEINPSHSRASRRLARLRERLRPEIEELDGLGKRYFQEEDLQNALLMWRRVLMIDPTHARTSENVERAERMLSKLEEIQASDL